MFHRFLLTVAGGPFNTSLIDRLRCLERDGKTRG